MNFVENPYLPEKEISLFVCDPSVNFEKGFFSYTHKDILNGINTHPDMTLCPVFSGEVFVCPESYEHYKPLENYGVKLIKGETSLKKAYPYDIAYNLVVLKGKLFHNLKYTDKGILKYLKKRNIEFVDVKQGYTKCSTYIVDENSVITCDRKLQEIYEANGIEALFVDNSQIKINGFDHGFIGGTGGKISKNEAGFFGDITAFKDYDKINDFLSRKGITVKILTSGPLFDYGSLIPLTTLE